MCEGAGSGRAQMEDAKMAKQIKTNAKTETSETETPKPEALKLTVRRLRRGLHTDIRAGMTYGAFECNGSVGWGAGGGLVVY